PSCSISFPPYGFTITLSPSFTSSIPLLTTSPSALGSPYRSTKCNPPTLLTKAGLSLTITRFPVARSIRNRISKYLWFATQFHLSSYRSLPIYTSALKELLLLPFETFERAFSTNQISRFLSKFSVFTILIGQLHV